MQAHEARRGTVVRVRGGHWKSELQRYARHNPMVYVLLEDGRLELFWLPNLEAVAEDIAV